MRLPRIPIWLPLAGLLLSFAGLSVEAYLDIAKALQDSAIARKTPDSLLLKKVFTSPVPADVNDRYVRDRIIRDAIGETHRNTLVRVYERKEDDRALVADNAKDISGRVPKTAADYALNLVREWESEGKDYLLSIGQSFEIDGTRYHLIGQRFPMSRSEISGRGEVVLVTNLDTTIAKTRDIFIAAKLKTATAVAAWGIVAIVINVVPVMRLTKRLNQGQSLEVWWWVPQQIADLAEQLELDRVANLRFRAEANAFRASIDLKSRMIDMSPVPTMICKLPKTGKQAIVTFANKAVATQFGYENIVGEPLNLLVPPEYGGYHTWASLYDEELGREIGMAACPHAGKSRVIGQQRPVPVVSKMGIRLQALLSVERIADDEDGSRNYIGTLQDITSLVQAKDEAQAAKREAEEYAEIARSTIDNLTDAIVFLKDSDGVYQLCNAAFAKIAGRDPIGLKDEDLAWTEEEAAKYKSEDAGVLATGTPFSTLEQLIGQRWFVTRKVKVSILGKPSVLGVLLDVDELIRAKKDAEKARNALEENLVMWRHDILSSAMGAMDMLTLLEQEGFKPPDDYINMWRLAIKKSKNVYHLIRDTREALTSDMESSLDISPVQVKDFLDNILQDYIGNNVVSSNVPDDMWISIDRQQFRRALTNLINNAIRYSNPPNEHVEISFKAIDGQGVFLVKDNGLGIAEEDQDKVLDGKMGISVRLHPQIEGTGLGLYSSKKIAEAMGGRCKLIKSVVNQGSLFAISAPLFNPIPDQ